MIKTYLEYIKETTGIDNQIDIENFQTDYCYVEFIFDDRKVIFRTPLTNIMTNKQYKQKLILNKSKKYNI